MKKMLLIINPVTAKTAITPHLIEIVDLFEKGGYAVEVHVTKRKYDALRLVRQTGASYDTVVCAGGDGTLNETVFGAMALKQKPKIGYIPAGTTNDFAASWGIPRRPLEAAQAIVKGSSRPIDVNLFENRPYIYVAAFGTFAEVSFETPQNLKKSLGWSAYIFEGIKRLPSIRPVHMRVEYDGGVTEGNFLYGMMSNTRRVGGFDLKIKDDISLFDGRMEMILIRQPDNPADNPKMLGAVLMQDTSSEFIVFAHTKRVHFEAEKPILWTIDGENGGEVQEGDIVLCRNAIEMFV